MPFSELLSIDGSQCIHVRNLQVLMTEVYKTINNLNPVFMKEIFHMKTNEYDLHNKTLIQIPKVLTKSFGYKSISFRGDMLWNMLPDKVKNAGIF